MRPFLHKMEVIILFIFYFVTSLCRLKRLVDVFISMCVEEDEELHNQLGPLLIGFVGALLQKGAIPRDVFLLTQVQAEISCILQFFS